MKPDKDAIIVAAILKDDVDGKLAWPVSTSPTIPDKYHSDDYYAWSDLRGSYDLELDYVYFFTSYIGSPGKHTFYGVVVDIIDDRMAIIKRLFLEEI